MMGSKRRPVPEARVHELLDDEIGRLVMRADRVERHEVEAVVSRVKTGPRDRGTCAAQPRKETVS